MKKEIKRKKLRISLQWKRKLLVFSKANYLHESFVWQCSRGKIISFKNANKEINSMKRNQNINY